MGHAGRRHRGIALLLVLRGAAASLADGASAARPNRQAAEPRQASADAIVREIEGFRGRPVYVNFWATWCAPCVEELPLLRKLHQEYAPRGVVFYSVSLDAVGARGDAEAKVRAVMNTHTDPTADPRLAGDMMPYPVVIVEPRRHVQGYVLQKLRADWSVSVPHHLFLGSDGRPRRSFTFAVEEDVLRRDFEAILPPPRAFAATRAEGREPPRR